MSIETTYRGHTIRYNENSDEWYCGDVEGKYSRAKLTNIKAAIDKMYLDRRKRAAVKCIEVSHGGMRLFGRALDAMVVEYVGEVLTYDSKTGGKKFDHHKVAVSAQRTGGTMTRATKSLDELAEDTPEVRAALEAYSKVYEEADALHRKAWEMYKAIPRLTIDKIAPLVELKKIMDDEGSTK
jgi:hypothetical protein